jgi:hypothetical protein
MLNTIQSLAFFNYQKFGDIYMKRKLIALAGMVATGASFAQVAITGQLGFSWQQNATQYTDGSHLQGLSMNDGEVYLSAKEDLGNGISATARGGFTMRGRGSAVLDRDGTITLSSSFGSLTAGALRACSLLDNAKSGAVTGTAYSSNESALYVPTEKCSMVDIVALAMPVSALPGLTLGVGYGELGLGVKYDPTLTVASSTVSITPYTQIIDDKANVTGVTFTAINAAYVNGPLMIAGDMSFYGGAKSNTQLYNGLDGWQRNRLVASYDFGVAKVAAGYNNRTWGAADQYIASIAVPVQNMVFGLDYMAREAQGAWSAPTSNTSFATLMSALNGQKAGDKASSALGLGVTYNFSKTTNLNASYIQYMDAGVNVSPTTGVKTILGSTGTPAVAGYDTEYRIRLLKTF